MLVDDESKKMIVNRFCFTVLDPPPLTFVVDFRSGYKEFRVQNVGLSLHGRSGVGGRLAVRDGNSTLIEEVGKRRRRRVKGGEDITDSGRLVQTPPVIWEGFPYEGYRRGREKE